MSDLKYMQKETISVFHEYVLEESEQAKQHLLRIVDEVEKTKDQKKEIVSELGSKLKSLDIAFSLVARNLKRNGEDRDVEALVYFDFHECKRIYKNFRGEVILTLPFKEEDYNIPVPLIALDLDEVSPFLEQDDDDIKPKKKK